MKEIQKNNIDLKQTINENLTVNEPKLLEETKASKTIDEKKEKIEGEKLQMQHLVSEHHRFEEKRVIEEHKNLKENLAPIHPPKQSVESEPKVKHPLEEKFNLVIDLCANKKELLKLKRILIEFENEELKKEKEIINNEPRKFRR